MVDDATLVKQLSKCSPDEIVRMGKADLSTNYRQLRYAKAILARYNLHKRDKLPYRFEAVSYTHLFKIQGFIVLFMQRSDSFYDFLRVIHCGIVR